MQILGSFFQGVFYFPKTAKCRFGEIVLRHGSYIKYRETGDDMFFGREEQIEQLKGLLRKRTASLVTCRGRRRIGKSTLIEVFARRSGCRFIKIEGRRPLQSLSNEDELMTFAQQLANQTAAETTPPSCWLDAFRRLNSQVNDNESTVILLDEVSWLAHYDK